MYQHGTHFVAVTPKSKECMIKEGVDESKISVIYPGIDLSIFKPEEKNKKSKGEIWCWERHFCNFIFWEAC